VNPWYYLLQFLSTRLRDGGIQLHCSTTNLRVRASSRARGGFPGRFGKLKLITSSSSRPALIQVLHPQSRKRDTSTHTAIELINKARLSSSERYHPILGCFHDQRLLQGASCQSETGNKSPKFRRRYVCQRSVSLRYTGLLQEVQHSFITVTQPQPSSYLGNRQLLKGPNQTLLSRGCSRT